MSIKAVTVSLLLCSPLPAFAQVPAGTPPAPAPSDRRITAVRAAGPIALDGQLNEPAWQQAPVAHEFRQSEPREGQPATYDTEVRVVYDLDALYVGVLLHDPDPEIGRAHV